VLDWLCFERCNSGGNVVRIDSDRSGFRSEWREFVLNLLSVFGANLDERVDRADCHVEADAFVKNANYVAIRAAFAPQLANQFAVSFELGAR